MHPYPQAAMAYPANTEYGGDLSVFVVRQGGLLELQNMSARAIGDEQLWLNRGYVATVEQLDVGAKGTLPLDRFRSRHGEPYPQGTFLAPDRSMPIVLAELFDPATGLRHRLIVRMGRQ